mgnify:CR=1 FL=1
MFAEHDIQVQEIADRLREVQAEIDDIVERHARAEATRTAPC